VQSSPFATDHIVGMKNTGMLQTGRNRLAGSALDQLRELLARSTSYSQAGSPA
jgi:hypothetical protein